ncbi:N-acetyl sugar amidotransferase [Methanoculleus sp. UBA303]|jgi:N-acetyl sugar amidotransferase|uniref:N-acetyl sugar amidotransferase n=1 Tax=Methanoculleus sp. UBA303 TaxID=1915497 RepID=UPI0025CCBF01|nr:N-acetyl sugar amidotransferase [Methanoculleus sp. UBA303]
MNSSDTYQICSRCVSDTTIPDIQFDGKGICNFCQIHDSLDKQFPLDGRGEQKLNQIVEKIQKDGQAQKYDCIVGISGGADSTFCLYMAKKLGLRPLAVHFDNGWNSEASVSNIKNAIRKLEIDLKWITADFEEFCDIQRSFLKASVPDAETPTDLAIHAVLHRTAAENGVKWIINGMNFRTEGIQPLKWSYTDGRYVRSVQEEYGRRPLVMYPNLTISDMINFSLFKGIKTVPLLAYMDYSKEETKDILKREVDWTDYGGHHFESFYTRFVITDILWNKFRIDKRKVQLSAAVRSGKLTRYEALEVLKAPPSGDPEVTGIVLGKIGVTEEEFGEILSLPPKTFLDYSTSYPLIRVLKWPIKLACSLNLIPRIFYEKYLGAHV